MKSTEWTADRVALLTERWNNGCSAAEISRELGGGATRCAVIGKARRLGLPAHSHATAQTNLRHARRSQPYRAAAHKPATRAQAKVFGETRVPKPKLIIAGCGAVIEKPDGRAPHVPLPKPSAWEPLPGVAPVAFLEAKPNHCRWPIELDDGAHWCCGAIATKGSYCKSHARRSAAPAQPKRIKPPLDFSVIATTRRFAA